MKSKPSGMRAAAHLGLRSCGTRSTRLKHTCRASEGQARALLGPETCSSFDGAHVGRSGDRRGRPHADRQARRLARPACTPPRSWAPRSAALLDRAGIDPALVEQVIGGCVTQAGEQSNNVTRTAWLHAGLPYRTGCLTVDAQCGSAQQADPPGRRADRGRRHRRRRRLRRRGDEPGAAARQRRRDAGTPRPDSWSIDLPNQFVAAERIATRRGLTRADLDRFGARSQARGRGWRGRDRADFAPRGRAGRADVHGHRDQGLRETTARGARRAEARSSRTGCTPRARRRRSPTARRRCC